MKLQVSDAYAQLIEKARWSHAHGRSVFHISQSDVDQARLFSYGYRSQAIGAFHATSVALESYEKEGGGQETSSCLSRVRGLLNQLEAKAGDTVPSDFRALISTL